MTNFTVSSRRKPGPRTSGRRFGSRIKSGMTILFFLMLGISKSVDADNLPAIDAPGFAGTCAAMYAARDAREEWPAEPAGNGHHCSLVVERSDPAHMNADDYRWALRKSMTFACKGKREVIYEVVRRLQHCDGELRTLALTSDPDMPGACRVRFIETGQRFDVAPKLIDDLIDWRDNMPWYEAVLVALFAPRELPMVMDGLIDCGRGRG